MAGSRPLTPPEERLLVRRIRRINARDRALIAAQLFLGFRISEILALTVGRVLADGQIRARVALPPRFLKGHYGRTRTIPIGPELHRALASYLKRREADGTLCPDHQGLHPRGQPGADPGWDQALADGQEAAAFRRAALPGGAPNGAADFA